MFYLLGQDGELKVGHPKLVTASHFGTGHTVMSLSWSDMTVLSNTEMTGGNFLNYLSQPTIL